MRQCYLFLLTLLTCLPAMAMTFQTRLENIEWKVEGDKFECRLIQPITDFGSGVFVRRAGEQAVFRLNSVNSVLGEGSATLLAAAAPWQPGREDINLGSVRIGRGHVLFNSSQGQAGGLFRGLLEGRSPVVRHYSSTYGVSEVRLLPVKFRQAYGDYQACTTKLLPRNFEQVRQSRIAFPGTTTELDASALNSLNVILEYLKVDPTVNRIILDGYSDNNGNRLTNRELSRRRALAVMDYFKAHGFDESQISLRFHGEQYPLVPNSSAANRAKNRRVTVRLERAGTPDKSVPRTAVSTPASIS
ncbi:OmpA family protein [Pseudomonas helleri]|uniref:OmpA family protein n=1 Tax=Pseudomonas helleri TaxID=1608996 RepID=A0A6A7YUZ6_9PSED|nr:OmpA family protein [Pseudomonas helleri]MQT24609.1 OmpA family protein [Pseudomonas helleri]MQT79276.1 OmpA family protein [Pseudomonas helleri]MQU15109.1 OmpA family protein [Pseudomonas helleri]MQU25843.1 OmpA family protein [Pseudomonas helleri]